MDEIIHSVGTVEYQLFHFFVFLLILGLFAAIKNSIVELWVRQPSEV